MSDTNLDWRSSGRTRFNNLKEFEDFCDNSVFCCCGKLMTGLHMGGCRKLAKIRSQLKVKKLEGEK